MTKSTQRYEEVLDQLLVYASVNLSDIKDRQELQQKLSDVNQRFSRRTGKKGKISNNLIDELVKTPRYKRVVNRRDATEVVGRQRVRRQRLSARERTLGRVKVARGRGRDVLETRDGDFLVKVVVNGRVTKFRSLSTGRFVSRGVKLR